MKILVSIKRAADYPHTINPHDLVALEQALRLRDVGKASEVLVVSIGSDRLQETLRSALAMGADRAIFVATDEKTESLLQPLAIAKIIQNLVHQEKPNLLILGGQVAPMLSALLNWPQATFVSQINIIAEHSLQVTREIDNGSQVLFLPLPAVITVNLSLNEPRVISIPNILKAKQKPFKRICLEDLRVDIQPRLLICKLTPVKLQRAGIKVKNVTELIDKLRYEAKVL